MYPHMNKPDSDDVQKNFGLSLWNDPELDDEETVEMVKNSSVFEGKPEDERN